MKLFVDTANLDEIRELAAIGIIDGVTTNPSLVAKEKGDYKALLKEICGIVDGPISAEVTAMEADAMVEEGKVYAKIHDNIVVKLPTIPEGLKACRRLTAEDIRVNMTLIFQPMQALLCARAGASFVSPFIGRLDDVSEEGMHLIEHPRGLFAHGVKQCRLVLEMPVDGTAADACRLRHIFHGGSTDAALMEYPPCRINNFLPRLCRLGLGSSPHHSFPGLRPISYKKLQQVRAKRIYIQP